MNKLYVYFVEKELHKLEVKFRGLLGGSQALLNIFIVSILSR